MEPLDSVQPQDTWKNLWEEILFYYFKESPCTQQRDKSNQTEQPPQLVFTGKPSQEGGPKQVFFLLKKEPLPTLLL